MSNGVGEIETSEVLRRLGKKLAELEGTVDELERQLGTLRRDYAEFKAVYGRDYPLTCQYCGRLMKGDRCGTCSRQASRG